MSINKENIRLKAELVIAHEEKANRAAELAIAIEELQFQNAEKSKRATELVIANEEKAKRIAKLVIANEEIQFQNEEKSKRAAELVIANEEKAKRAADLVIANEELQFQNEEKSKRAAELVIANEEKAKRIAELVIANKEKAKRVDELIIATKEKTKRANELRVVNEERVKELAELVIAKLKVVNHQKLQLSLRETIDIARQLVELRDPYTAGHETNVGNLAKTIAAQLGFDDNHQEGLMVAGFLHDLGKIVVPVEILCKPGKLSTEEYNLVKNHVQAGYDLLKGVSFPWTIARSVLEHHERLDGSGYPNHLIGSQISVEGCILAVADVVDAMASNRPYRPSLGIESALTELDRGRGVLYDEKVVDACINIFREKSYKMPEDYQ